MDFSLNMIPSKNLTSTNESKESLLIAACLRDERWAQKELYESYYSKLLAVCIRYSNNYEDARDILNEGFVKVFRISIYGRKIGINVF
jgi:RNA polymerase sigma-70 factor (ECF subfamily)